MVRECGSDVASHLLDEVFSGDALEAAGSRELVEVLDVEGESAHSLSACRAGCFGRGAVPVHG